MLPIISGPGTLSMSTAESKTCPSPSLITASKPEGLESTGTEASTLSLQAPVGGPHQAGLDSTATFPSLDQPFASPNSVEGGFRLLKAQLAVKINAQKSEQAKNVWAVSGLWDRLRRFKGLRCCEVLRGLFPIVSVKDLEQGLLREFQDTQDKLCGIGRPPSLPASVDCEGLLVAALAKRLVGRFSPEVGEFLALREGLLFAKSRGLVVRLAEVDACNIASCVLKPVSVFGEAALVIQDIKALFREVGVSNCRAIPRLSNRVAHSLVSLALSSVEELCWQNVCLSDVFPFL
ncbi:hypothetical protein ACOSQ4_007771 [Xanthoceras sorbifolium]